jgi:predicted transcriptional regulator
VVVAKKIRDLPVAKTRLPEALYRRLERAAKHNRRSISQELVHRISRSFAEEDAEAAGEAAGELAAQAEAAGFVSHEEIKRWLRQELGQLGLLPKPEGSDK